MATTKTLTPTNQAITLAAFTEKPDNRTNVTNDDKLADAVNALNSNLNKSSNVLSVSDISANASSITATFEKYGKMALIHVTATCNQQVPTGSNITCKITGMNIYGNSHGIGYAGDTAGVMVLSKAANNVINVTIRMIGSPLISGYSISCTTPIIVDE